MKHLICHPLQDGQTKVGGKVVMHTSSLAILLAFDTDHRSIPMAKEVGFDVVLIDPRSHFGTSERFPGVEVSNDWPDDALKKLKLSDKDCLVTLTHDPKIDDPALHIALASPLFSICCLGSKKTHKARKNRLLNSGITEQQFDRIHGPAGLDINAKTPAEIAISILAELVKDWRGGS